MLPEGGASPPEVFASLLADRLAGFGLEPTAAARDRLARYLAELDLWRRRTNLTGPFSAETLVEHALESALGAELLPEAGHVADIGSGAGFPGVPLAILRPDIGLVPVEPRRKRREFLDHVRGVLDLDNVAAARPTLSALPAGGFSGAVSRAVGDVAAVLGSGDFLQPGAVFLAWTTEPEGLSRELDPRFRLEGVKAVPGADRKKIAIYRKVHS